MKFIKFILLVLSFSCSTLHPLTEAEFVKKREFAAVKAEDVDGAMSYVGITLGFDRENFVSGTHVQINLKNITLDKSFKFDVETPETLAGTPGKKYGHIATVFPLPPGSYRVESSILQLPYHRRGRYSYSDHQFVLKLSENISGFELGKDEFLHIGGIEIKLQLSANSSGDREFYSYRSNYYFKVPGEKAWGTWLSLIKPLKTRFLLKDRITKLITPMPWTFEGKSEVNDEVDQAPIDEPTAPK